MRTQFAFYKSFDDVYQDLNDKQKLEFMNIILDVQFLRLKIDDVVFKDTILKHIWNAQKHSIEKSIKGYLESQKNPKIKEPFYGVYDDNFIPLQTPSEGNHKEEQEKGEEKEKVNSEEIEKRFNAIWSYYKIPAKAKGLKNKALSSFINKKVNKRSGEDIKLVIDAELKKEVGQRHLVTIFNNFEDSLEMARDIILEVKATKLKPTRLV